MQGSEDSDGRLWAQQAERDRGTFLLDKDDRRIVCSALFGIDVSEIYSPARVTAVCSKLKLIPGCALDFQTGWDFTIASHRVAALKLIREQAPRLIVGSPPCTMLRLLQELTIAQHGV